MRTVLVLTALLLAPLVVADDLVLHLFGNAEEREAQCNDGTPSGYYIRRSSTGSKAWLLYLEGGGLCYDFESCKARPKQLISSDPWAKTLPGIGIFANSTSRAPSKFGDWNQVVVIYCTSDLYSGTANTSGLLGFKFHGSRVVPSLLDDLSSELVNASEVVFAGGSAGGIGVFVNYPYVKSRLAPVPVRAIPDAGWFLNTMPVYKKGTISITDMLEKGHKLWGGMPATECANKLGDNAYLCYSGPVVYPFMPSPPSDIMVLKAQTDAWTVGHDKVKMPPDAKATEWLMELAAQVRTTFQVDQVVSVFSANCLYHTSLMMYWTQLAVDNSTLQNAVESWYFDKKPVHLVDTCTTPFCNPTCV